MLRMSVGFDGRPATAGQNPGKTNDITQNSVIWIAGVVAALLHREPVAVFRAMALPVRCDQVGHLLNAMATAGFDAVGTEMI